MNWTGHLAGSRNEMESALDVLVREVKPDDAEDIVHILNPIIRSGKYSALDRELTPEQEKSYIVAFPRRGTFFVIQTRPDGPILGFQSVEPFAEYTRAFDHVGVIGTYIDLGQRGKGLGKRLAQVTFQALKKRSFEKLFTYVRADNVESLAFHLALGFNIVGTAFRHAKLGSDYLDEVIMEKFL